MGLNQKYDATLGMEWQIPIQKVEIVNIHIGNPWSSSKGQIQKPMAPLSYFGTQFRLPFLSIVFPSLPVVEYNPATGKLVLDISETSLASIKLTTLQDTLINAIMYHQMAWFKSNFSKEDITHGFQPLIQENQLLLHCPYTDLSTPANNGKTFFKNSPIYKEGSWNNDFKPDDLKMGTRCRVAVKIHGISFLNRNDKPEWSGKCRLQHKILGIILQN